MPSDREPSGSRDPSDDDLDLGAMTTETFARLANGASPLAVIVPVGSVEPHGPHLPLETDTIISVAASRRAATILARRGVAARIAPPVPYGVTDFACGFAGAISVPAPVLSAFLSSIVKGYLEAGAKHVCLVNNHLEPAQDAAVRSAIQDAPGGAASVACPLTRRWARTLSAEFKSGACHAGRYESSIVLSARPDLVRNDVRMTLPEVPISLSEGIRGGKSTFAEMGMTEAYAGAPAAASADEGEQQLELLATMIVQEVTEALGVG